MFMGNFYVRISGFGKIKNDYFEYVLRLFFPLFFGKPRLAGAVKAPPERKFLVNLEIVNHSQVILA